MSEPARKKRLGRPKGAQFTYIRSLRFNERDAARMERLAEKWELTEAQVMRRALKEAAEREGVE